MKKILYIMCAVLMGALASCSKSDLEATDGTSALQTVRISVYTDQTATRTTIPEGISRFAIEVYADAAYTTAANVFADGSTNKETNDTGVFNVILDKSKTYYCLFWADNGDSYTITNLQAIALTANKSTTEAFYGTSTITTTVKEQIVPLKRAVSMISLTETKALAVGTLTVAYNEKPGFNIVTAKATGTETKRTVTMNLETVVAAGNTFGDAIYSFADADQKALQDVEFTFKMTDLAAEPTFTVTNVPLQANYTTNIKGHFTTKSAFSFDVTCGETWGDTDNDVTFPEPDPTIIGYFSGEWIEVDANDNPAPGSGIWRLSKQTVVANKDVSESGIQWATGDEALGFNNNTEGKSNTLSIYKQNGTYQYPAATACFKLNNGYTIITEANDTNYKWYLPAQNQLMAVWIANNALIATDGFKALATGKQYWTSTEETSIQAWYVSFQRGLKNQAGKTTTATLVRCIRDL